MAKLVFGEKNFVSKAIDMFDSEDEIVILLNWWRRKLLCRYVKELLNVPLNPREKVVKGRKLRYLVRLFWLGPLMACYGLALENKMTTNVKELQEDNCMIISFSTTKE